MHVPLDLLISSQPFIKKFAELSSRLEGVGVGVGISIVAENIDPQLHTLKYAF